MWQTAMVIFRPMYRCRSFTIPATSSPAVDAGSDYFFTASRLDGPKRLDLLVRAFRATKTERRLLIAGTGPQQEELETLIGDDERIVLLGRISDAVMRRYYSRACCVPFLPEDEDYGLITVEAMQAGKPVLTCPDTGGVTELVENGVTGWVVEASEAALAEAIDAIASDTAVARDMAAACRERVADINWEATLAGILDERACLDASGFPEQGKPNHILVPLTFPVYPPRSGGQSRVFHLYRRIAQYVPVTLLTLCGAEEAPLNGEIAPGLRELRIPKSEQHQAGERAAERKIDASIADLYAIEHVHETMDYISALKQLAATSELVVASHPYLYRAIRSVYRGAVYYESHNVEYDMKRDILVDRAGAAAWLDVIESTEGDCAREAVGISACSEEDRERLSALYGVSTAQVAVVPNGVSAQEVPRVASEARARVARRLGAERGIAALFVGSWHGPNIEAVQWLIEHLAPAQPEVNFWIVGSVCNFWKKSGNKPPPANVILLGQLDEADKNAVLSCAQIALNPVMTGSGSNLKMAEYAVAGLPVLSTPFGCRGLEVQDLPAVQVAELDDFNDQLTRLIERIRSGTAEAGESVGRKALIEAFDWDGIADGYFAHLVDSCSGQGGFQGLEEGKEFNPVG